MAYRLSFADDVASSVRLCARERLADAVAQLEGAADDPVTAVHEARKDLKKTRALLRLVRPALSGKAYRRENEALREIGLALSGARDADVRVATAESLAEHAAGRLPADAFEALAAALAAEVGAGEGADGSRFAPAIERLRAAELRVDAWPLGDADWDAVLAGVTRAHTRGRDAFAAARATPDPELLHAWRKRAKDLWYHQRLLAPAWPDVLGAQAEAAHALSELLGDDHDLAVLAERLVDDAPPLLPAVDALRAELRALIAHRSEALRAQAVRLGRRVYAESPKAFSRRLGRYVELAVAETRDGAG
ncbi:MAG TPA: CHAD domain-containing protein [Conexibacter sp.]|nr:CHAD domain-containing protein [Conexibacter sp.]